MAKKKSKLLAALDAHKGRDYEAERQKKLQKVAQKRKRTKTSEVEDGSPSLEGKNGIPEKASSNGAHDVVLTESEGWESDESGEGVETAIQVPRLFEDDDSDSDSSLEVSQAGVTMAGRAAATANGDDAEDADELGDEEEEDDEDSAAEDIPFSDIESLASEERGDILPHQRLTINNTTALLKAHKSIALSYSTLPFSAHQVVTTSEPVVISDVNDDLTRELAFYKQCLSAAEAGRAALIKEGVPFTRPSDYFAEMVKSEEQMGRVKQKMVDEAASKKAASEARRLRDLRKFGKQVQVAKLQERSKAKREALEKIEVLKRKRKNNDTGLTNEEDLFDIALDNETSSKPHRPSSSSAKASSRNRDDSNPSKRRKKDEKFGFGGKKRFAKSNDALSTGDLRSFSAKKMKTKGKIRPGKSKRGKKT